MIRRPPRSTPLYSSAASDVYKRQPLHQAAVDARLVGRTRLNEPVIHRLLLDEAPAQERGVEVDQRLRLRGVDLKVDDARHGCLLVLDTRFVDTCRTRNLVVARTATRRGWARPGEASSAGDRSPQSRYAC